MHFGASWSPSCEQLNTKLVELQKDAYFYAAYIDAEAVVDVSYAEKVEAAPTLIMYKVKFKCFATFKLPKLQGGNEMHRLTGFQPEELGKMITMQTFKSPGLAPEGKSVAGAAQIVSCFLVRIFYAIHI